MSKGTKSQGKRGRKIVAVKCRRCGLGSYHATRKVCSSCGFGRSTKMRTFAWSYKDRAD
ncbi:MAG TPA: 50S ribosomal protein L37e [Candidatus Nanoarchaeia archaeon]|nr:50S ribosomal protein L37e [Candidatus Nanoarchaeia archaeon]